MNNQPFNSSDLIVLRKKDKRGRLVVDLSIKREDKRFVWAFNPKRVQLQSYDKYELAEEQERLSPAEASSTLRVYINWQKSQQEKADEQTKLHERKRQLELKRRSELPGKIELHNRNTHVKKLEYLEMKSRIIRDYPDYFSRFGLSHTIISETELFTFVEYESESNPFYEVTSQEHGLIINTKAGSCYSCGHALYRDIHARCRCTAFKCHKCGACWCSQKSKLQKCRLLKQP